MASCSGNSSVASSRSKTVAMSGTLLSNLESAILGSAVLETRFAFLDEGRQPLLRILGPERKGREVGFDLPALLDRQVASARHRLPRSEERPVGQEGVSTIKTWGV